MNLTTIRKTLGGLSLRPSKSLGQNFLHDQNLARWLSAQLEAIPGEHVVEIGPGLGALTEQVLESGASVTAIEKDRRLVEHLNHHFPGQIASGQLTVLHGDAAEFDVRTLWPRQPVKVLGNLPYYISTPLLFHFTGLDSPAERLLLVLQRELAERLAAGPGTKDYGILSLVVQRRWRVKYLRTLPASVFTPVPKVASGAVLLIPRQADDLPPCDGETFERLVRQGFSQRRKQMGKLLAHVWDNMPRPAPNDGDGATADHPRGWPAVAARLGVPLTSRAEELSLEQWIALAGMARPVRPGAAQDERRERFDVVDEKDIVLGTEARGVVHSLALRHRAVHIFVLNGHGELFLQKRSPWKDKHPGKWDSSAAGHLDAGERYESAARRELAEELALENAEAVELTEIGRLPASALTGWEFIRVYMVRAEGPFRWPLEEIEWGGFFPLETVVEWIEKRPGDFAPGFLECWRIFTTRTFQGSGNGFL